MRASPPSTRWTSSDGVGASCARRTPRRRAASAGRAPTSASSAAPRGSVVPARRARPRDGAARRPARSGSGRRPSRAGQHGGERLRAARGTRSARRRRTCPSARAARRCGPRAWANTMPRVASVSAGVSASTMPVSKTITRVGAALVGEHPLADVVGAGLLGALDQHAHVDGQLAGVGHLAGDVQQRQEVALVVGGAAGVEAAVADVGLERRRGPRRSRRPGPGRRSGRRSSPSARPSRARAQLADDERRAARRVDQLARAAGARARAARPLGGRAQRGLVARAGRDRRDPQPVGGLVDQRVELTRST